MGDAIIPGDWAGEYCKFAVCWPNSPQWLAVLRGALSIPQEGRFWDEQSGQVTEAQGIVEETFDYNFRNWEVVMACGDSGIENALLAIATALQSAGTGGDCGGGDVRCFSTSNFQVQNIIDLGDGDRWPVYGSVPGAVLPETGFPGGYTDLTAYDADKCAKATKLAIDFARTVRNFGEIEWGLTAVTAVAVLACLVGIITVPEVVLPTLMWILLSGLSISAACTGLANWLDEHQSDVICALYEGETVDGVISAMSVLLSIAIAAIAVEGAVAVALKQLALLLLSTDTVNLLFTDKAKELYPAADCSSCEEGGVADLEWEIGSGDLSLNGEVRTLYSGVNPGNGLSYIRITNNSADPCCEFYLEQGEWTGERPRWDMMQYDCESSLIWETSWFFGTSPLSANIYGNNEYPGMVSMGADEPFTLDVILDVPH